MSKIRSAQADFFSSMRLVFAHEFLEGSIQAQFMGKNSEKALERKKTNSKLKIKIVPFMTKVDAHD